MRKHLMESEDLKESPVLIKVRNLSLRLKGRDIFREIHLDIRSNRILSIVGHSGAGKTSLLKCMNGLIRSGQHTSLKGKVSYRGKALREYDPIQLSRAVGMIFQKPTPFALSIRQNFMIPLKEYGVRKAKDREAIMEEVLRQSGLWEEVKDRFSEPAMNLSGGQMQRLCVARALLSKPDVLLMDEPCSSLDPESTERLEQLMVSLKKRMALVLVTHNMEQAKRLSDEVAFMSADSGCGKIVLKGGAEILRQPPEAEMREFMAQV